MSEEDLFSLELREKKHAAQVEKVERTLTVYQEQGQTKVQRWEKVAATMLVVMRLLIAFFPAISCYCASWVTWGVMLPMAIITVLIYAVLKQKIALNQNQHNSDLLLKELLRSHHSKKLSGESVLKPFDKHLRSDNILQDLESKQLVSTCPVNSVVDRYDLDTTPLALRLVANYVAGIDSKEKMWNDCKNLASKAKQAATEVDYFKKREQTLQTAYGEDWNERLAPTVRSKAESAVVLYHTACQLFEQGASDYRQGVELYSWDPKLWEAECAYYKPFLNFQRSLAEMKQRIGPLIEALNKKEPVSTEEELLDVQGEELHLSLVQLVVEARQSRSRLKVWLQGHPSEAIKALQEEIEELKAESLSLEAVQELARWVEEHPLESEKKCVDLLKRKHFLDVEKNRWLKNYFLNLEMSRWLKSHPPMRLKTPKEILSGYQAIGEKLHTVLERFATLQATNNTDTREAFEAYGTALNQFKQDELKPLKQLILRDGESSKFKYVFKKVFSKPPIYPFPKIALPKEQGLQQALVLEKRRYNHILKEYDEHMVKLNYARKVAVVAPMILLTLGELILSFIVTGAPEIYLGLGFLNLVLWAISYSLERYLKRVQEEKQAIKLLKKTRLTADMEDSVNNAALHRLRRMQHLYDLGGVAPTRAWVQIKKEKSLPTWSLERHLQRVQKDQEKQAAELQVQGEKPLPSGSK